MRLEMRLLSRPPWLRADWRDARLAQSPSHQKLIWTTVVVGMAFEARIADGPGIRVICGTGGPVLATLHAGTDIIKDCRGLMSFWVAGGLSPNLRPGACIVGSAIVSAGGQVATHRAWSEALLQSMPNAIYGMIAGVPAPIARPDAKRALHIETGAIAVDMESHIVARVAVAHGLPIAAVRVIIDPAERRLPQAVLAAFRPNGTTDIIAMIQSVIRQPRDLPGLLRIALDAGIARSALIRDRRMLESALDLADTRQVGPGPWGDSFDHQQAISGASGDQILGGT
jgi:adenosylhomocysteine nucleosidase